MIAIENGHVQNQAGILVPNGQISFQLNIDATILASPGGIIPAQQVIVFQLDESGDILPLPGQTEAQIWSNAELNPQNDIGLGTYYLVSIFDANGARINKSPMWWQFPEAANSTVDISQMTGFATIGGNVIYYPTTFVIEPPTPSSLGGVFSNAGGPHLWISAINMNGSVTLSQPSFTDISGTLSADQLPSPLTFNTITASGLITAQDGIEVGIVGTTAGQIALDGLTSGQAFITAPAVAGTAANPVIFSNSIQVPSAGAFVMGGDTGLSRVSAAVVAVGNGTPGNASGTIDAAAYQVSGTPIAASDLSNGVTGTGAIVLAASPTLTGTIAAAAINASGIINAASYEVGGVALAASNLSNGVTGTGAVVLAASPTITGTLGASAITASGAVQAASLIIGAAGPTITAGAGVPSGSAPNGSLYINTSGTHAGPTLLYIYDAATTAWVAIA
jgi:hypothetical protein